MDVPGFIGALAKWLHIGRSDAAELAVVFLGSLMSVVATLAAWIAAMATARSVKEMQSARRQSALPHIDFRTREPVKLIWPEGKVHARIYSSIYDQVPPYVELYNSGTGPAINIFMHISWGKGPSTSPRSKIEVARILGAGSIRVRDANNGLELFGESEKEATRAHYSFFPDGLTAENCPASSAVKILIPESILTQFAICVFGKERGDSPPLSWRIPITVTYSTVSNERISRKFILSLHETDLGFIIGDPAELRKGFWHWSQVQLDISISIHEDHRLNPSLSRAVFLKFWNPVSIKIRNFGDWYTERKLDAVHKIETGGKRRRLRPGDRVIFRADKTWVSAEDIEIPDTEDDPFSFDVVEPE